MKIDYTRQYCHWHNDSPEHLASMVSHFKSFLVEYLPKNKEAYILEIGCGMGFAMLAMIELGYKNVIGIDIDEGQIDSAKSKGLTVYLVENTENWLMENKNFDFILLLDVLEHIPVNIQINFIDSIYNAFNAKGVLLVKVPNANNSISQRFLYDDFTHFSTFTNHRLDFVLYNGGFCEIEIFAEKDMTCPRYPFLIRKSVVGYLLKRFYRYLVRCVYRLELGNVAKEIPLSLNIIGLARK